MRGVATASVQGRRVRWRRRASPRRVPTQMQAGRLHWWLRWRHLPYPQRQVADESPPDRDRLQTVAPSLREHPAADWRVGRWQVHPGPLHLRGFRHRSRRRCCPPFPPDNRCSTARRRCRRSRRRLEVPGEVRARWADRWRAASSGREGGELPLRDHADEDLNQFYQEVHTHTCLRKIPAASRSTTLRASKYSRD